MAEVRVVLLAGGVGGAKVAEGLQQLLGEALTVVGNVGDDFELWGLTICPDLDTLMYTLAGVANPETGWGVAGDTFAALGMLARYGEEVWFRLGDQDLATHVLRTALLRRGWRLTEVTAHLAGQLGARARLLPVTDAPVRTRVITDGGELAFQEYFVRRKCRPAVRGFRFAGAAEARPTPEVSDALMSADAVVIAPSNPFVSVEPMLAVGDMRARLHALSAPVIAVTPIVGGEAIKGPTAKMFRELGEKPSALAVARRYADIIDAFVLDTRDAHLVPAVEALGLRAVTTDTLMFDPEGRRRVALVTLEAAEVVP
ncbi:MAG: 2-phospho-L-lactate transferase [Ardenticatenia bacterium]|nr:2-phospho-L-lactate transferase [Ardenticatenia bacterium]